MSRSRKWLAAVLAGVVLLGLLAVIVRSRLGLHSHRANPGLTLTFLSFTNIGGQWHAQMIVSNPTEHLHFVEADGNNLKYWGTARTPKGTNELHEIKSSRFPLEIPSHGVANLLVELPDRTESWEVSVTGYQGDFMCGFLITHTQWFARWPDFLAAQLVKLFIEPVFKHDFEVSSGILTNRPPEP